MDAPKRDLAWPDNRSPTRNTDEWPNLASVRFPDGDKIGPIERPRSQTSLFGWIVFLCVVALVWLLLSVSYATEAAPIIFEQPKECTIDTTLRVYGTKRGACIDKLEAAMKLAKAEQKVNERKKRQSTEPPSVTSTP